MPSTPALPSAPAAGRHRRPSLAVTLLVGSAATLTLAAVLTAAPEALTAAGLGDQAVPVTVPVTGTVLTDEQIASLSPQQQAIRLDPLRDTAAALDLAARDESSGAFATLYAGVRIDAGAQRVDLFLTEPAQAPRLFAAAHRGDPGADLALVRVHPAAFDRAALETAALRLLDLADGGLLPFPVYAAGPGSDGSAVTVRVPDVAAAGRAADRPLPALGGRTPEQAAGAPLHLVAGRPMEPKSWVNVKWHDSAPFLGGDAVVGGGGTGGGCTAGLPAVRVSTGRPVLVTAAHCFGLGARVYTRGGAPGAYRNGLLGAYVGTVTGRYTPLDAVTVEGAGNRAAVSLTGTSAPLRSAGYSYDGDFVCHDGQRSYFLGHPTPCNIKVTDSDLWCSYRSGCPGLGYRVRGVWGDAVGAHGRPGWGAADGDSGATIFAYTGKGLQARGVLSDGDPGDGAPGVFWPEAPDVLKHFGLKLNPHS